MRILTAYLIGLLFGLGIVISGMANPAKILNFFDIAGTWDPSLAFVIGGALMVTAPGYWLVLSRAAPVLEQRFQIPHNRTIDLRLIGGAALFGIGWGITGFCPGGALPALGTGRIDVALFAAAMVAGIITAQTFMRLSQKREATSMT